MSQFGDERLDARRLQLEQDFLRSRNCSIHKTCQGYGAIKAGYRFLANDKVSEEVLTADMVDDCASRVGNKDLIALCDTSMMNFDSRKRRIKDKTGLGSIGSTNGFNPLGLIMHSILVHEQHTGDAVGISATKLWSRPNEAKRTKARRFETKDIFIEHKESIKWIDPCIDSRDGALGTANHITFVMDREGDIMEVLDRVSNERTDVLVRAMHHEALQNL